MPVFFFECINPEGLIPYLSIVRALPSAIESHEDI